MIGVGGVTFGAQKLGEKNKPLANYFFSSAFVINIIVNLAAMVILIVFQDGIIHLLNANGILKGYVRDYLGVIKYFYLFMMTNLTFSMFIRSEGKPQLSLVFGLAGNILNIVLDYLFIMKWNYGMKGAALASGVSVLIPFIFGILYFSSKRSVYKLIRFKLKFIDLQKMVFCGSAEFISQIATSITIYIFNRVILNRMGINGVAAYTVIGYVLFFQSMILTGIAIGIHPLISFHFGAKNKDAIFNLLSIALKSVFILGIVFLLVAFFGSHAIVSIFSPKNETLSTGKAFLDIAGYGLKIFAFYFLLNGYNMIAAAYFTSVCEFKAAAIVSLLRSLVLINILVLTLPYLFGNTGIWLAAPLTEGLTFIFSYFQIKQSKSILLNINPEAKLSLG